MRVLWVCNIALPRIAKELGLECSNKEGWLTGLSDRILAQKPEVCNENECEKETSEEVILDKQIVLGVCFPGENIRCEIKTETGNTLYGYGFEEDVTRAEVYDDRMEGRMKEILEDFKPDLVHCFGTEYPHTLAMTKAYDNPDKTLIGIQGLCAVYANHYKADLPYYVWNRSTIRDRIKKDSLITQKEKFEMRGTFEIEAVRNVKHILGRTKWDAHYTKEWNPDAEYHFMNETLRSNFYEGQWNYSKCTPHSIFLSQGDYPIKGLHYLLQAMPLILERYPDTCIRVAGNSIIKSADRPGIEGMKGRLKLDSYGKYIMELLGMTHTKRKVTFLGRLTGEEMKKQYLAANVFLCPSSIENSPNSVGEAMLLGMPIVCADVGGISSIFTDKKDGLLYQVDSKEELANAICTMFEKKKLAGEFAQNARIHALDTHNADANFDRLLEIYREVLGLV